MLKLNKNHPTLAPSTSLRGFTIVELLVVIVVIAILAAITIVSYTGISNKAVVSSLQSDLDNNSKLLKMYYTDWGYYPTSIDPSTYCPNPTDTRYCLKTSNGNTLEYFYYPNSDNKYELVANKDTTKYYITQNTSPSTGGRNLLYLMSSDNASFEGGTVGNWSASLDTGVGVNSTAYSYHGTHSLLMTRGASGGRMQLDITSVTSTSTQYTLSSYIKGTNGTPLKISLYDSASSITSVTFTATGDVQRVSITKTFSTGTLRTARIEWNGGTAGDTFYADAIQLETGSISPF